MAAKVPHLILEYPFLELNAKTIPEIAALKHNSPVNVIIIKGQSKSHFLL